MRNKSQIPFLERCGLTIEGMAVTPGELCEPATERLSSILMLNDVVLSHRERPSTPTASGRSELVRVELRDNLLTIAVVRPRSNGNIGRVQEAIINRYYALRTVSMADATVFMLLRKLPSGASDERFTPAEGTVVLYDDAHKGRRFLKACVLEENNSQCEGWIFHAREA